MKIVMLEPLGVERQVIMDRAQPLIDEGHEFIYCGAPLDEKEKIERAKGADAFIIANKPLTADVINAAENLQMISVGFTGIDHIDIDTCREKNVTVCNAQGYATNATGELAIGLMLACLRNIVPYTQIAKDGGTLAGYKHNTLMGKTVGIVGTGAIGRKTAQLAKAFGCELLGYSRSENAEAKEIGIKYVSLKELFAQSDIVSLHAPLTEETAKLVSKDLIDSMKKSAILINCARGGLVDSRALADALNEGRIAAAGIDVFETEPPIEASHPLLNAKNVALTPHVGFYSEESLSERVGIVFDNIDAWLKGEPINVVAQ